MYNLKQNGHQRKDVRQAIQSGFAMNSAPRGSSMNLKNHFGSVVAKQMDAEIRLKTGDDVKRSAQKLGDYIIALPVNKQLEAVADMQAMIDVYKEVFDEVKAEYGYHGTFEQYIQDVLEAVESAGADTPMEQIGQAVLTHQNR